MALIKIEMSMPPVDGMDIKFKAPCDCTQITGLLVEYPEGSKEFTFRDTHGNDLTGLGNLFFAGTYVKVLVDTQNGYAYLQNADNNTYIEKTRFVRNLLDNSDFTQFIAQAGIGGNHGNQSYAGDRWILDSGTVTGDAREDGNGYTNITLNGTIRQIVANPPDVGTAAIEMVSGTAQISYANGEIIITSNGGVIRNVRLFKGAYTADNMPNYQTKGYGAEYLECLRYYRELHNYIATVLPYIGGSAALLAIDTNIAMRVIPSLNISSVSFLYGGGQTESPTIKSISKYSSAPEKISYRIDFTKTLTETNLHVCFMAFTGKLNADFPEE